MYMKMFVVHSDIPPGQMDAPAWVLGVPKMLREKNKANVKFVTTYCSTPDKKIIGEFHADDKEVLSSALSKIGMPFTQIMEATKKI
jgi:hypothetical protein